MAVTGYFIILSHICVSQIHLRGAMVREKHLKEEFFARSGREKSGNFMVGEGKLGKT